MGLQDNFIPEEKLPQCWSEDVRMNALFAPFRIKSANPESWEMKMKFWSDMLKLWCRCKKDPMISAADAKFTFQRKGRTPACIDIVVEEMFRSGELSPISKYQQILHSGAEGWVRWGARLAFKPAAFALTAVSSFLPARQALDVDGLPKASIESTQRFVLESAVKEQATELLQNYRLGLERIGTVEELMRNCEWHGGRETFEVLLGYLVAQGYAIKKDDVVKLAEPDKKATPVTETDAALVKLMSAETRLEGDATRLARDIAVADSEARAALQIGNRLVAKNHLRRKHKLQQRALRCEATLDNVRQLLQQMKEVEVNATIAETYRVSSQAIKRDMHDGGLDLDAVHETMDDLKDALDNYNEVEKALHSTIEDCDGTELELELQELLLDSGTPGGGSPRVEKKDDNLPSPPMEVFGRKVSERDFVFDGEERIIAELNELSVLDASPRDKPASTLKSRVVAPDTWNVTDKPKPELPKPSQPWYPTASKTLESSAEAAWSNNNLETSRQRISEEYTALRQDDRLHPGQPINVDYTSPPTLYNTDFQVQDHKEENGVWFYNSKDGNSNSEQDVGLGTSTEYCSSESPGKTGGAFQMAPGGERRKSQPWPKDETTVENLERRLNTLRGLRL